MLFKLDETGSCETCHAKARDSETICCDTCKSFFHALCDSPAGKADGIALKTHFGLFKSASTKNNFIWKCDMCLTISEEFHAASVKEMLAKMMEKFSSLETKLSQEIKQQVSTEFSKLVVSQSEEFSKLSTTITTSVPPLQTRPTVWDNGEKVKEIKSSLMIKADKEGRPVNAVSINKLIRDNGIPVIKVVAATNGDTFINLPNEKVRDELQPLLQSDNNKVVSLKSKLPTVSLLGVEEELSRDDIKNALCKQNNVIGKLVNDEGEELSVVYTRPPSGNRIYHQVTIRVSSRIRSAIKSAGDIMFLSSKVCKVIDSFHIRRCNKCQSFGHYAGKCESAHHVCGFCGEHHPSGDCLIKNQPANTHKCVNCQLNALDSEGHSTFYYKCPAYVIQQDKLKNSIAYNYNLN